MENEEKNIQENIEELQNEQLDSMFGEDVESSEEVFEGSLLTNETEINGLQELENEVSNFENTSKELEEPTEEQVVEFQEEKVEESLEEEIIQQTEEQNEDIVNFSSEEKEEFSFLDGIEEEKEVKPEIENTQVEKLDDIVSFADDFEVEAQEELITVRPIKFQQFEQTPPNRTIKKNLDILQDVSMHVSVELGRTKSSIREVMEMEEGSVVELDKIAGEQVEIFVNDKLVAKGEVIVIEDKFGVRITATNIQKQI